MALVRLIYTSKTQPSFSGDTIKNILETSRAHNGKKVITGCLFYNRQNIIQYLEGGSEQINQLYNRIVMDERHSDVQLIDYSWINKRMFVGWSMGFAPDNAATRNIFLYYLEKDSFNPASLTVDAAVNLIKDLKDFADSGV